MLTHEQAAKPGVIAEKTARLTPKPQLVSVVVDTLGLKLSAYIVGIKDTRTLSSWAQSGNFDLLPQRKLQAALAAISLLGEAHEKDSIAPWFTFISDALDDSSPAAVLNQATEDDIERAAARVLAAARRDLAD